MTDIIDIAPLEVRLSDEGRRMEILWEGGAVTRLPAAVLRRASRSAGALREAIDGAEAELPEAIAVTRAEPVGAYALRLSFSDGHDRGIFPWSYLRDLGTA
ncbi:MAG: DUF971 domain-containing protein [Hansschlegelia sp.]